LPTVEDKEAKRDAPGPFWIVRRSYLWLPLLLAVVDWGLLRLGLLDHPAWIIGVLATLALAGWLFELGRTWYLVGRSRLPPVSAVARTVAIAGALLVLGAGVANWAWSLQGYVVLRELEAMPVLAGGHLRALERGPLADLQQLDLTLQLEELELLPSERAGFFPASRLRVRGADGKVETMRIDPWHNGAYGKLRFYQGAFGFAPQIIILRDEETLFDEVVPFTTEGHGAPGHITFEEEVEIGRDDLAFWGAVDLASLDEALRGHATVVLQLKQGPRLLGEGRLSLGHFAEVDEGYRIGFVGLERWSEIDISRRNYRRVARFGLPVAVVGLLAMALTRWRRK
jgi:hypothetical protein